MTQADSSNTVIQMVRTQLTLRTFLAAFAIVFVIALTVVFAVKPATASQSDIRQVIYRYVEQVQAGNGLVFNANERVLLVPSPVYLLLLSGSAVLLSPFSVSVLTTSRILFALSLALGAASLFVLARYTNLSRFSAIAVAVIYCVAWSLWNGIGTAFPLAGSLCLLVLLLAIMGQWQLAGIIAALAVLCTPETAVIALILLAYATNKDAGARFITPFGIILIAAIIILRLYYGPRWWEGLLILRDNATTTSLIDWLTFIVAMVLGGLAFRAWIKQGRSDSLVSLLAVWIITHLVIVAALLRVGVVWHYSLIVGPLALLAIIGLRELPVIRFRYGFECSTAALIISIAAITLLHLNTADTGLTNLSIAEGVKTIGFGSTNLALATTVPTSQSIISLDGQFQPDLKSLVERGDTHSMLIRFAPDLVILSASRLQPRDLVNGSVRMLNYQPAGTSQFQRMSQIDSFQEYPVWAIFGTDIKLVGAAIDRTTLKPGDLLRVRLDWQVVRPASVPVNVDLRLRSDEYLLAHIQDSYEPRLFSGGSWSTYHALVVLPTAWDGPIVLEVAVIVSDGTIARVPIATITVD